MATLTQSYNKLVEETLTVEDPRLKKEQEIEIDQQNNRVQNVGESAKSQDFFRNNKVANQQKKNKIHHDKNKI